MKRQQSGCRRRLTTETIITDKISRKTPSRFTKIQCSKERRRKDNQNYRQNLRIRKQENLENSVKKIKEDNVVVNMSSIEIPDHAYIYIYQKDSSLSHRILLNN